MLTHVRTPLGMGLLLVLAGAACGARTGLDVDDTSCTCLDPWSKPSLSDDDIALLATVGRATCFPRPSGPDFEAEAERMERDAARCLPKLAGLHDTNGLPVEVYYECSDLCPSNGFVGIRYRDVTEADCAATGGRPDYALGWMSYVGCRPGPAPTGDWWD